ncbi:MAG: T9SS type A sorting domain-containing protein [Bacteroidetes bacterium]|nr:T9SS type A sorting domain-containing protein [Bacteroidota bacterium]
MRIYLITIIILQLSFPVFSQVFWEKTDLPGLQTSNLIVNPSGLSAVSFYDLDGNESFYFSDNSGKTWVPMANPGNIADRMVIDQAGRIYVGDDDGLEVNLRRSTDFGKTWETISDTGTNANYALGVAPSGRIYSNFIFNRTGTHYMSWSDDHGDTWTKTKTDLPPVLLSNLNSQSGFLFDESGKVLYLGMDGVIGLDPETGKTEIKSTGMEAKSPITSCRLPDGTVLVFANFFSTVGHIYRSENFGESWSPLSPSGLPQFTAFYQLISTKTGVLYGIVAGTQSDGVYRSFDQGQTWENVSAGLGKDGFILTPQILAVTPDDEILCGTNDGLYRSTQVLTSVSDPDKLNPDNFRVSDAYPNPFNPETSVTVFLPEKGILSIQAIDLLGRVIQQFKTAELQAGEHTFNLGFSGSTSGIYFIKIQFGNQMLVKKVQLVK